MGDYLSGWAYAAFFLIAGPVLILVTLTLSRLLRTKRATKMKLTTYESGEVPFSQAWAQVPVHFYLYALLFVVFDVEALFFLAWAMNARIFPDAALAFVEMMIFVVVLVGGLLYAWRKGALKWV